MLEIPGGRLLPSDLASGIYAITPAVAFTLLYGTLRRRPWPITTILLFLSLVFVPLAVTVYVTSGVWVLARHAVDIFTGSAAASVVLGILFVSLALVLSSDMAIGVILEARRIGRHLGPVAPMGPVTPLPSAKLCIHLSKVAWAAGVEHCA